MARTSTVGLCVLALWGVLLSCRSAEREFFLQNTNLSWASARSQCQRCFSELVTLTPDNIQRIAMKLSSAHWIGLRKRPVNASDNSTLYPFNDTSVFWSQWANGDPLSFQNWYPGYPVFKSPVPKQDCCSCSCTCPLPSTTTTTATTTSVPPSGRNKHSNTSTTQGPVSTRQPTSAWTNASISPSTFHNTSLWSAGLNSTLSRKWAPPLALEPFESECVKKPMALEGPDPNEDYIEDTCVAMLDFGAWVERECSDLLPFICYEDKFNGEVNVTNIKHSSASLSWRAGPGNISHYRLEVSNSSGSVHRNNINRLDDRLENLDPGTFYSVQVTPVKCDRDLNPQTTTFYTVPNKVTNLMVINQAERCVFLNWSEPQGNVNFYIVTAYDLETLKKANETRSEKVEVEVCGLTPGTSHNFSIKCGVGDLSKYSEETNTTAFTKPAQVSNLNTSDIKENSLTLKWDLTEGGASEYEVTTSWLGEKQESYTNWTSATELKLENLPSGTQITLTVAALVDNRRLEGESLTVVCFTRPVAVQNLRLTATADSITATWDFTGGSPQFKAELRLNITLKKSQNITDPTNPTATFDGLNSATTYTVSVYSITSDSESLKVNASIFTKPNAPRAPELSKHSKKSLTFSWTPPINSDWVVYNVTLSSDFWGQRWTHTLNNITTYTFSNLTSGSNYSFSVQTKAGEDLSDAVMSTACTEPFKKELTLSMVCSSKESLLCDKETTRNLTFEELKSRFRDVLGDHVYWKLERVNITNTES